MIFFLVHTKDIFEHLFGRDKKAEPGEEPEEISEWMKVVHTTNAVAFIYAGMFFLLIFFGLSMHYQVMDNVTTNEKIRKRWNAKNRDERNKDQRVKACDKFRYIYLGKLPVSRIQRYHELREEAIDMAKDRMRRGSNQMISHSSFAGSVGGGSVAGAGPANGFDLEDLEMENNLKKYVRMVQKGLLKEIDNEAVLASYGIDISSLVPARLPVDAIEGGQIIVNESIVPDRINASMQSFELRAQRMNEDALRDSNMVQSSMRGSQVADINRSGTSLPAIR